MISVIVSIFGILAISAIAGVIAACVAVSNASTIRMD